MADAVTISLLPIPLALVHIPRSRLQALSHPVLRHILHPSPTFFNVTANEIEISLFVDYEHVQDFEVIAEKDKRSQRKNPVEISYEPWSVLQIDSHTDQLGEYLHSCLVPLTYSPHRQLGCPRQRAFCASCCGWDLYSLSVILLE